MPLPQFGKKSFKRAIDDIRDDQRLINQLVQRLLQNNITSEERARILAHLATLNYQIGEYIDEIEEMGKRANPDDVPEEKRGKGGRR